MVKIVLEANPTLQRADGTLPIISQAWGQQCQVLTLFKGTETTWQSASFFIKWETTLCNVSIAEHDMGTTLLTVSLLIDLVTTWR